MQVFRSERGRRAWLALAALGALSMAVWRPWADDVVAPPPPPILRPPPARPVRLPDPVVAPAPRVVPQEPLLRLIGTSVGGTASFATVSRKGDPRPIMLHMGDRVDGLSVTAIERTRIVLAGDAKRIVIDVDESPAAPAPPRASSPLPTVQPPSFPEGEAPWDAGPGFRH